MEAKDTVFDGYRFRSRLEARYAVFFKTLGLPYEYEKEDFFLNNKRYLPDFYLPQQRYWIEIKGQEPTPEEINKCQLLALETGKKVFLFYGSIWIPGIDDTYERDFHGMCMETIKKGAYDYDPEGCSLTIDDTSSPCYEHDFREKCIHEQKGEACPAHQEIYMPSTEGDRYYGNIHLNSNQSHLIRAIYTADVIHSLTGDSCKLQLDNRGQIQYLVPTFQKTGAKDHFSGYKAIPLPVIIRKHKKELEQLLSRRSNTFQWGIGAISVLYSEPLCRWCECPICGKLEITIRGETRFLSCPHYQPEGTVKLFDDDGGAWNEKQHSLKDNDDSNRLVVAYTAARQARFEHR